MSSLAADLEAAAEAAISSVSGVAGGILLAGFAIAVGYFIYKKVRGALSKG